MPEIIKVNMKELKSFDEKKFNPKVLYQTDYIKVVAVYFEPGQFIPVHSPGVDVVLCVLEGEAEVVAGKEKFVAKKNDLFIVPKGIKRGVKALTKLSLLHVVQPPPSEKDHIEVHQKLAAGRFE
ncbi:MAG: cupin domain-containing protein [Deltaproteobacteria bacterium]|nr:cupin domain-containing protein [Deltaproteobacteria bacterium]